MNTKIITALVVGIALFGLTGAASANDEWATWETDEISFEYLESFAGLEPVTVDVTSGVGFDKVITNFDTTYGYYEDGTLIKGAEIEKTMKTTPTGDGGFDQTIRQSGYAKQVIRGLNKEDGKVEFAAEIGTSQDTWFSGTLNKMDVEMSDTGYIGAYGLVTKANPGCGNCVLYSNSEGTGTTEALGTKEGNHLSILHDGTFWMDTVEGVSVDLSGTWRPEAFVYGGSSGGSTFEGTMKEEGSIHTRVTVEDCMLFDQGDSAILMQLDIPPCNTGTGGD